MMRGRIRRFASSGETTPYLFSRERERERQCTHRDHHSFSLFRVAARKFKKKTGFWPVAGKTRPFRLARKLVTAPNNFCEPHESTTHITSLAPSKARWCMCGSSQVPSPSTRCGNWVFECDHQRFMATITMHPSIWVWSTFLIWPIMRFHSTETCHAFPVWCKPMWAKTS